MTTDTANGKSYHKRYNRAYYMEHQERIKAEHKQRYDANKEEILMRRKEARTCRQCGAKLTQKNCVPFLYGMGVRWRGYCETCWEQRLKEIGCDVAHAPSKARRKKDDPKPTVKACGTCGIQQWCDCGNIGLSEFWVSRCKDYRPKQ